MIKVIACKVFETYIQQLQYQIDVKYLDVQMHNTPKKLRKMLQDEIDQCVGYDYILILYGLCGNVLLDLKARDIPLIVIKAHDCLSILLGGHQRYLEYFEDRKSSSWTCRGLKENNGLSNLKDYQQWIIDYGQEEADYLKSVLVQPCHIYIKMREVESYSYDEIIMGDISYLKSILDLTNNDLLVVTNTEQLKLTNDHHVIKKIGIE